MPYLDMPGIEMTRMCWLAGGLAVIVIGILFAQFKSSRNASGWGAMQYPQLTLGMLAIFVYVGVEVAIGSNLGEFLKQPQFGGFEHAERPFVAMFWGSLMIGRWAGSRQRFPALCCTEKHSEICRTVRGFRSRYGRHIPRWV